MARSKTPCVYILASDRNGTLYIGVTSDLHARMAQHTQKLVYGFTAQYNVTQLVYYEMYETMEQPSCVRNVSRNGDACGSCG